MARGFTIVEILITITVMGILLTLGVVGITATQVQGRDAERQSDVSTIQTNLENFYRSGDTNPYIAPGSYPSTAITSSTNSLKNYLPDADTKPFIAPGATATTSTFIQAQNNMQTTSGVSPQPTIGQYVYQPINTSGALCTSEPCRKYNIFYRLEKDNQVYMVSSRNT